MSEWEWAVFKIPDYSNNVTIPNADLGAAIRRLERQIERRQLPVGRSFRPGLMNTEITDRAAAVGMSTHPDMFEWWGWRDGAPLDEPSPGHYWYGYWHPPFEDALKWWLYQKSEIVVEEDFIVGVPDNYVPILLAGSHSIVLDVSTGEAASQGNDASPDEWLRWGNLASALEPWVAGLEAGKGWPPGSPGVHTSDPNLPVP